MPHKKLILKTGAAPVNTEAANEFIEHY